MKNRTILQLKSGLCSLFFLIASVLFAQSGQLHFKVIDKDSGELMPARLTVLKNGLPHDLKVVSEGPLASRNNTLYTAIGMAKLDLPEGTYELWFGRGMEYAVEVRELVVKAGEAYSLKIELKKELNTDGLVSGDMHLHTYTNSGHGDANLIERVISCAAEGLDWAVATDHNFITDYRPYLEEAGLTGKMATAIGNEASTSVGHFNIYPLPDNHPVVDSKPKDANILFPSFRKGADSSMVIQINHPRWVPSDYFNTKGLDPYFGTIKHPEWSWDFDAFEVLNENYQLGWITAPDNLQSVKRDWFNLLNRNLRYTGLGNSDSHSVVSAIAGVPRNYILSSTDDLTKINEIELAQNIKAQKLSVACGILPQIIVNGNRAMGESFETNGKAVQLQLHVQAPSWVSCHKAELICNGRVVQEFKIAPSKRILRLDTTISILPQQDSWYLLVAYGDQSMYPMVGKVDRPVYPLGFTNPMWVDAQGDNKFVAAFDYAKQLIAEGEQNTAAILRIFKRRPALFPATLYHLFQSKHPNTLEAIEAYTPWADTEQKLMIFRELAKTDLEGAQPLMEKLLKVPLYPLEEINLASFTYFPIRQSRVKQFKQRKAQPELDDQLNYLSTELTYLHSGAKQQKVEVGFSDGQNLPKNWNIITADKYAFLQIPKTEQKNVFIKTNWKMRRDTLLPFYFNHSAKTTVWINGKKGQDLMANAIAPTSDKIVPIRLNKGNNELVLQFPSSPTPYISFLPASEAMLIDPQLELVEVDHLAKNLQVQYINEYHYKYHGYDQALTDGFRGTTDFKNQLWQGWEGEDAAFTIDLGQSKKLNEISIGLLADQGSWIFFPTEVEFWVSMDGKNYESVFSEKLDALTKLSSAKIKDVGGKIKSVEARFVKFVATKIESLPEWHSGKGKQGWIFVDEAIIR